MATSHTQSRAERSESMYADLFTRAQLFFLNTAVQNLCLGNGTTYHGLGLSISINLSKTILPRHTHRPTHIDGPSLRLLSYLILDCVKLAKLTIMTSFSKIM